MVRKGETINTVMLQEDIRKGQRVESFTVEGWINEEWSSLAEGTTIGYKRLLHFGDVVPEKIRVTIHGTRDIAHILKAGAYYAPRPGADQEVSNPNENSPGKSNSTL